MELTPLGVSESPAEMLLGGVEAGHDGNEPNQDTDQPAAADQTQMSGDRCLGLSGAS